MTPEETIKRIADVAEAVGWQAGVGAMELAGMLISVLARHPEKIEGFISGEVSVIDDDELMRAECGCLTFHNIAGDVTTPAELHASREVAKIKRAVEEIR